MYLPNEPTLSLFSDVNRDIVRSSTLAHSLNCCRHCSTETLDLIVSHTALEIVHYMYVEVHKTMVGFLIVQHAVMPTKVFPAPQGSTMIPERARLSQERKVKRMAFGTIRACTHCQTFCLSSSPDSS